MKFSFHPDAEAEFDKAVAYYGAKQSGLDLSLPLADEVLVAVTKILEYQEAGQPFSKNTRGSLAERFSYGLTYQTLTPFFLRFIGVIFYETRKV